MRHTMRLHKDPFEKIEAGTKTIELRLFDEKRQQIKLGDEITFTQTDSPSTTLKTKVVGLLRYRSLKDLFQDLPPKATGSDSVDDWHLMRKYYSEEDEKRYGVIGIKLKKSD